jgi:hypothetical protein
VLGAGGALLDAARWAGVRCSCCGCRAGVVGLVNLPRARPWTAPIAQHLFAGRPVEWLRWLLLGAAILAAGFGAGLASLDEVRRLRTFLLVLGGGLVLVLLEDAGDAREVIGGYRGVFARWWALEVGPEQLAGSVLLLVVVALPVYASVRFGRDVWGLPMRARRREC